MRVDELTSALREATAAQPHVDGRLDAVYERRSRRRRTTGGLAAVAALVVVAVTVGIGVRSSDDAVITDETGEVGVAVAGEWEPLPSPPIPPRTRTTMVWTGDEVLVIGGDGFVCGGPGANCSPPKDPLLADGAAFDPDTRTWRRIADAPVGFAAANAVVIENRVFLLLPPGRGRSWNAAAEPGRFLRYSIDDDAWTNLPLPAGDDSDGWSLVAADTGIVATQDSVTNDQHRDRFFDTSTDQWSDLPGDPLGPGTGRHAVWIAPYLYQFAGEVGSVDPSTARVARLDLGSGVWEELPPARSVDFGLGPFAHLERVGPVVHGSRIVEPRPGVREDDSGEQHAYGGIYDVSVPEWRPLPEPPDPEYQSTGGAIGRDRVWVGGTERGEELLLDLLTDTWVSTPSLDACEGSGHRNLIGTDRAIVAYGGEQWPYCGGTGGGILDEAWILTFDRP